jgi:hypothetical protein
MPRWFPHASVQTLNFLLYNLGQRLYFLRSCNIPFLDRNSGPQKGHFVCISGSRRRDDSEEMYVVNITSDASTSGLIYLDLDQELPCRSTFQKQTTWLRFPLPNNPNKIGNRRDPLYQHAFVFLRELVRSFIGQFTGS